MIKAKPIAVAIAAIVGAPAIAVAQSADTSEVKKFETVQVTAKRLEEARNGLSPDTGSTIYRFERQDIEMLPLGDLRSELTLLARWNLSSLARRSDLTRLVYREAHRLPRELLEQLYEHLVDRPYARIVQWLQARYDTLDDQPPDLYPIALILTQTMSAYRSLQETFGRVPDSVDDERYIAAWVDVALAVAARYGVD